MRMRIIMLFFFAVTEVIYVTQHAALKVFQNTTLYACICVIVLYFFHISSNLTHCLTRLGFSVIIIYLFICLLLLILFYLFFFFKHHVSGKMFT